jgi:hypothetical protein
MTKYKDIQDLLTASVNSTGADPAPHRAFWKTQTRDQFVGYTFRGVRLISATFDPNDSGLVKALEGTPPFAQDTNPADTFPRMPAYTTPMPAAQITIIRNWIAAGCPA